MSKKCKKCLSRLELFQPGHFKRVAEMIGVGKMYPEQAAAKIANEVLTEFFSTEESGDLVNKELGVEYRRLKAENTKLKGDFQTFLQLARAESDKRAYYFKTHLKKFTSFQEWEETGSGIIDETYNKFYVEYKSGKAKGVEK